MGFHVSVRAHADSKKGCFRTYLIYNYYLILLIHEGPDQGKGIAFMNECRLL